MNGPDALILAIDLSAETGSLALIRSDHSVRNARQWAESRQGNPVLWKALSETLQSLEGGVAAISCIAVSRGPGRYTGLRVGLSLAQALALPTGIPVHAVDSGEALAYSILSESGPAVSRVAIAGDARRGQYWIGFFRQVGGWPESEGAWALVPPDSPLWTLPPGTVGASPEWSRLSLLSPSVMQGHWIHENRSPGAVAVGRLALHARAKGAGSAPLFPLYLHPAVKN